jgi:hypothetical protein
MPKPKQAPLTKLETIAATLAQAAQAIRHPQIARRLVPSGRVQAPRHDSPRGHAAPGEKS